MSISKWTQLKQLLAVVTVFWSDCLKMLRPFTASKWLIMLAVLTSTPTNVINQIFLKLNFFTYCHFLNFFDQSKGWGKLWVVIFHGHTSS